MKRGITRGGFAAINQALDGERLVPQWVSEGYRRGNEWVARNPNRADRNPGSFSINLRTGVWRDFADEGAGGSDLVSLYAYLFHGNDQGAAAKELAATHGIRVGDPQTRQQAAERDKVASIEDAKPVPVFPVPADAPPATFKHPTYGEPTATWTYSDKDGRTLIHVCRFDPPGERKQVIPRTWCKHPDGATRWTWRGITGPKKRPLYGLDRLAADAEADAILVEGEKTADAAQRLFGDGPIVTTWLGGVETADRVNVNALAGRRVILWPDFDSQREKLTQAEKDAGVEPESKPFMPLHKQPGVVAMMNLAQALKGVAREVFMVRYPVGGAFGGGWDLADAEAEGWTHEQVAAYMAKNSGDPWTVASGAPGLVAANDERAVAVPDGVADVHTLPGVPFMSWPHMSDKGQPLNTIPNLRHLLTNYQFTVRYDVIRKEMAVTHPGQRGTPDNQRSKAVDTVISLCALNRLPKADVPAFLLSVADDDPRNPVMDFITLKPWDGRSRFAELLGTVQTRSDFDRELFALLLRRWLTSAVAAAAKTSGFWSKGVLVFQGEQSLGKTAWIRALLPPELRHLVKIDATIDPNNKDSIISAVSHWIVELGELDGTLRKADIARLKGFISQDVDQFRRPYARAEEKFQRRTVFFASVNPEQFLADDTGNVRWWTVPVVSVDYAHAIDMQQLWAEVFAWFAAGESWWLDRQDEARLERSNAGHQRADPIEELIQSRYDATQGAVRRLTATEVLIELGYDKPNKALLNEAGHVMRRHFGDWTKSNGRKVFSVPPLRRIAASGYGWTLDPATGPVMGPQENR